MIAIQFHPDAQIEFLEAIDFYESQQAGLGLDFLADVEDVVHRIQEAPLAWSTLESDLRRCLCTRFPHGVVYAHDSDGITVVAVMHLHRNPGYWRDRKR